MRLTKRFLPLLCVALFAGTARSEFTLSVDPDDLTVAAPGAHQIEVLIRHGGSEPNTLSGYTFRLNPLPDGIAVTGADDTLGVAEGQLFNFNPTTNEVAASNLSIGGPFGVVPEDGQAVLTTLDFEFGDFGTFEIPFDFRNAQRGGLFAEDITSEFNTLDSFTVTVVPEPGALLALGAVAGVVAFRIRSRRSRQTA